jgi:GDP/UDP-N,N'-diacetylbacillosamine 2-epimerase (hydrolysing)
MRSTLSHLEKTRNLSLSIAATGMHLSREFGYTAREIEKDGFQISAKIPSLDPEDTGAGMLRSFSTFLRHLVGSLERLKPDIVLLLGDRWEMLAGAMAGSYMNIVVAHIHGGELSGSVDEPNRHAITRFSHVHLVATKEHAKLLRLLGEEPNRIHVIGSPGLDDIVSHQYASTRDIAKKYKIGSGQPHLLLVQHPVVTERHEARVQITNTLNAIAKTGIDTVAIYPNADAGGREMIEAMKRCANRNPFIRLYRNIPRYDYLGIMACSSLIIGNSSSGIIEAASFSLPAINIGTRQQGRIHPANVLDVGYNEREIYSAIHKALSPRFRAGLRNLKNPYGSGRTGRAIARILSRIKPSPQLLQKRLTYKMVQLRK